MSNTNDLFPIGSKAPESLSALSDCVDSDLDSWAFCHKDDSGVYWTVWVSDEHTVIFVEKTSPLSLAYYGIEGDFYAMLKGKV